jgi:tetratricopeptide (TPR) repeat protein
MNAPRLRILMLLLIAACLRTVCAQEAAPVAAEAVVATDPADTQLRINMTTLLENPSQKNRVDAAVLLLASDAPEVRTKLLEVLSRADNVAARAAVCEALSPTRVWPQPIKNREDFIGPLVAVIISEQDFATVRLAAEATLAFGYSQVAPELDKVLADPAASVAAKNGVIYTIRRHPDKQAVARLFSLVDSPDPPIVDAARSQLASLGIAVSPDPAVRQKTLEELQGRGAETFLRERVIRQETRMREIEAEREAWQKKYLTALSTLYSLQGDEAAKAKFLATYLGAQEARVKIWALDRLEELRQGTGTSKAKFSEIEASLIPLISDPSRDVRLSVAKRLAVMGQELNVAKPLLDQLNVEPEEQVRREILVALREVCYVASLATTGRNVPEEIRSGALVWAVRFLGEPDTEKARIGGETIGKLLEQNGLKPEDVNSYLKALADRYSQVNSANDTGLRGYLLGAMAGLCSPRSACREQAAKHFGALFEQALADKTDAVRQIAVDGLVNVSADKASALRKLRTDLGSDPSLVIRVKLIDLAGEAGGPQELTWLVEKLGIAGEGDPAWQAILKIFRRSNAAVLTEWAAKIEAPVMAGKITPEQRISFFTLAEQKAQTENKTDLLKEAQVNLANLYFDSGNLKQASEYLRILLVGAAPAEKPALQAKLVYAHLMLGSLDQARELLANYLSTKDLDLGPENSVVKSIEAYFASPTTVNPSALLDTMQQIQVADAKTLQAWRALLSGWTERYAKVKKTEDAGKMNN